MTDMEQFLIAHGVKPTANRLLVASELARSGRPLSLSEIEERLLTVDKSSIFRSLGVFREHALVHVIEDGGDGVRYELCHSHDEEGDDDIHAHFYCERCHRTFCLYDVAVPQVVLPEGFRGHTTNFMIKGVCPECKE